MRRDVREIADAVLHEGYLLYPYRPSALKNRHRCPFGTLFPEPFCRSQDAGDASSAHVECLVTAAPDASITALLRFLQFSGSAATVREARIGGFSLAELESEARAASFEFAPVSGELRMEAARVADGVWKVRASVRNTSDRDAGARDEALADAIASAHLLATVSAADPGGFVSLIDPPDELRALAEGCRGAGWWPVLAGSPPARDTLLAAPIILYDYPELAPESPGDFFDGTEIDELLTLRVLTLTDEEKREMSAADPRAQALLERTEAAGLERLANLHGRMRRNDALRPGQRVRLRPKPRGDVFDLALAGKIATIAAIERDFEGRTHVVVTVDDDPGKDLGAFGHRFFFSPEEVELL